MRSGLLLLSLRCVLQVAAGLLDRLARLVERAVDRPAGLFPGPARFVAMARGEEGKCRKEGDGRGFHGEPFSAATRRGVCSRTGSAPRPRPGVPLPRGYRGTGRGACRPPWR